MGAIGDMDKYLKFKSARAIGDVAQQEGGGAGAAQTGLGLGAGLAAAQALSNALSGGSVSKDTAREAVESADDPMAKLQMLKEMLDAELITESEYEAKKDEILKRL
jgi:membrane protease subunit (stomatin/prohibitin family)